MIPADVLFRAGNPAHDAEIDYLDEEAFGPGPLARAAYKIPFCFLSSFVVLFCSRVRGVSNVSRPPSHERHTSLFFQRNIFQLKDFKSVPGSSGPITPSDWLTSPVDNRKVPRSCPAR